MESTTGPCVPCVAVVHRRCHWGRVDSFENLRSGIRRPARHRTSASPLASGDAVLVLGAWFLVPGPSQVRCPWCAATAGRYKGLWTKDQGRTKNQALRTKD